ncbi:hypothetical protein M407DRAFT_7326 [Tulasnella calospora MUT 4182]|uniref:F-box domain-containing protein n=1 Tax=Tulasnella calospora MUT 4182 TaxID=1051891 RepID=A0A0C3QAP4_9AGAM|nr:hypothetical protein M407DRAFT_7326 [Tulasnella calospora MUT 4182]
MQADQAGPLSSHSPPTLPNEIKSQIARYLDTTADVLALLLVDSEFREIGEKILYRDISFDCKSSSSQDCPCIGCLRTIRSRPAAAGAVRSFEVSLPRPMTSCLEEYYRTFPYMTSLEELVMMSMDLEDIWIFEGVAFPNLRYYRGPPTALARMSNLGSLWALKVSDYAMDTPTLLETVMPLTVTHGGSMVHLSLQLKDDEWRDHMMEIAQGFSNLITLSIEGPEEIEEYSPALPEERSMVRRIHLSAPHIQCIVLGLADEGWRLVDSTGVWITRVGRRFDVLRMEDDDAEPARRPAWHDSPVPQDYDELQKIWERSSSVAKRDLPSTWGG